MPLDENGNPILDENGNPVPDAPVDPVTPPDPPVDPVDPPVDPVTPPVDPVDPPAPATHTIGDDIKAVQEADAQAKADADALVAAQEKAKASSAAAVDAKSHLAGDLKKIGGDTFTLNPDGTATAYYTSATNADGFYTEILKPADTVVPEDAPSV